jgi:hypothetical protein
MIYVVQCQRTKAIKIGYTKNDAKKRVADLQVGSPGRLVLIAEIEGEMRDEKMLHRKYHQFRADGGGEWFDFPEHVLAELVSSGCAANIGGSPPPFHVRLKAEVMRAGLAAWAESGDVYQALFAAHDAVDGLVSDEMSRQYEELREAHLQEREEFRRERLAHQYRYHSGTAALAECPRDMIHTVLGQVCDRLQKDRHGRWSGEFMVWCAAASAAEEESKRVSRDFGPKAA